MKIENKAILYVNDVISGQICAPKYVKKQCEAIKLVFMGEDKKYIFDEEKYIKIYRFLSLLKMPKGLSVGNKISASLSGFQWLLIVASLCIVYRQKPKKRRYTNIILEIARKNGKTFIVAVIFLLLFFFEPKFSQLYSVAPDGALSREIKKAIEEIINYNSAIFEMGTRQEFFKIRLNDIFCKKTQNKYIPLNYSNSRLDGKLPNVFLCDEVGALPTSYAFEAMRSGQLTILNKLGFLISTKYPTASNPFEDEVDYAKKALDGLVEDEEIFALLYEPDCPDTWMSNDEVILQANPLCIDVKEIFDDLCKKRERAINVESARENFLTKHCNIIYQGTSESYVPIDKVKKCARKEVSFKGKEVYLGVDLSMTNDNCAVGGVALDDDCSTILAKCMPFIPEGRIEEKTMFEKVDYRGFINAMKCIACGDMTVDYSVIEKFVLDYEEKYGCTVIAVGYDRYNAISSAQKWESKYNVVEIRQHSDTLHLPTKLLSEKILNGEFEYEESKLLEINFENSRCTYDTNMNRYVNKKKSKGKVDMVVSIINALYLLQQDVILGGDYFGVEAY